MSWLKRMDRPSVGLRLKRALDICVASGGLVVLSPAMLVLGALVVSRHGWPPLFVQSRPGLYGEVFAMRKLRTMTDARSPDGEPLSDAERLTSLGRFLRASSLDELPELWHVLVGEMSLVGPRPLLVEYLERYSPTQSKRHEMPPGITGLAQVRGRNTLSWEEKFALDVEYVERWSMLLDISILLETIGVVIARDGISPTGEATMPIFRGSEGSAS